MTGKLALLRERLRSIKPGEVPHSAEVIELLNDCWDEIEGTTVSSMTAHKLDRAEQVTWDPPELRFVIERHGAVVWGSIRAELQGWTINVDLAEAHVLEVGRRQIRPSSPRLDVDPLARLLASAIEEGTDDPGLKWVGPSKVRVLIGKVVPDDAPKQTVTGRRKRLREALARRIGDHWTEGPPNTWKRLD